MEPENYLSAVQQAADFLKGKIRKTPRLIVVLSGGLDPFVDAMENKITLRSTEIPHFPKASAQGHAGQIIFGEYAGCPLVALQGRYHYYEGLSAQEVVFPYFVLHAVGASTVMTTNAVGGIREDLNVGDIMVVTDHINMMGTNPLIGLAMQRKENQFTSMLNCYDADLIQLAKQVAAGQKINLKEGVYVATHGPCYETKSEIRAFRSMGADTVGMSTAFEVIASRFVGMKVVTFNIITNPAADRHTGTMNHQEVLEAMQQVQPKLVRLLQGMVEKIA